MPKNPIIISGGGHKMAAGLKLDFDLLDKFIIFLDNECAKSG